MTSRRDFVRAGLALSTLSGISWGRAVGAPAVKPAPLFAPSIIAIADWTFAAASAEFAQESERHGFDVRGFDGDVGGLWLRELGPTIAAGRVAVVGLTGPGVLFCLETLARSHGFGAVFRAERPAGEAKAWPRVAARHALAAAASAASSGGITLAAFAHHFEPTPAEPRLLAWALARDARRPAARVT